MDAVKKEVEDLVYIELENANRKFPMFSSTHEGYAVILEEVEEASECLGNVNIALSEVWSQIKMNATIEYDIDALKCEAINLAVEAIQVAAMAQKFIDSKTKL